MPLSFKRYCCPIVNKADGRFSQNCLDAYKKPFPTKEDLDALKLRWPIVTQEGVYSFTREYVAEQLAKEKVASELRRTGELRENEEFRDWPNRQFVSAKFLCDDIIQREDIIRFHKTRRFMPPLQRPVTGVGNLQDQLAQAPATQQFGYTSIREDLPSEFDSYEPHLSLATIWPVLLVTGIEIFIIILMSMVQTAQILGNIDLWLHSGWQPQIRRIWGWLRHFWSFAIPKLRLRLPPRIESGPLMVLSREKGANHGK